MKLNIQNKKIMDELMKQVRLYDKSPQLIIIEMLEKNFKETN